MTETHITGEEGEIEEDVHEETRVLEPEQHYTIRMASMSDSSSSCDDQQAAPLWLITFTDVMALMLTFFVLLYSMSVPQEEKWKELSTSLNLKLGELPGGAYNAGSQDVINIDQINTTKALDLRYLKTILTSAFEKQGENSDILIFQNEDRLIISLPSGALFESGSAQIGVDGKKMLFTVGGVLARIKNRIEVVGHTDPQPVTGGSAIYQTNWELSLARANALAGVLYDVGYTRDVTVRGLSSARYEEMDGSVPLEKRYKLSRRVDLVVMKDDGYRYNAFDP